MPRTIHRTKSVFTWIVFVLGALAVAVGGTLGTLWAMGVPLPFFGRGPVIGLPFNRRPLTAYTKVSKADLVDPQTGRVTTMPMPLPLVVGRQWKGRTDEGQEQADVIAKAYLENGEIKFQLTGGEVVTLGQTVAIGGALVHAESITGRVLKSDKSANLAFTEDNFLPKGTREGIAGGVPQGKRAYRLDASEISGFHGLKAGDHFDLLASVPLDLAGKGKTARKGPALTVSGASAELGMTQQAAVRPLIQDGVVVTPVTTRDVPVFSRTLTSSQVQTKPVQEIVIAVEPEEVAQISQAVSLAYKLTVVARSGQATDDSEGAKGKAAAAKSAKASRPRPSAANEKDETPGLNPLENVRYVEVMRGNQVEVLIVPGAVDQGR
jgi:hypothetical protein